MNESIPKYVQAIGTLMIGLALICAVAVSSRYINQNINSRTLVVTGKAVREIPPNQSKITGTWQENADTADSARNNVRDKAAKGISALKDLGILESKITTTQTSVNPTYDYSGMYSNPKVTGYQGSTTIQVVLTDPTKADQVISALTKAGTANTSGPSLDISTTVKDQIQKDLKVAAVADATNQAKALATQAGGRLGEVVTIAGGELNSSIPPTYYPMALSADSSVSKAEATDISLGTNEMTVTVSVTFRLN